MSKPAMLPPDTFRARLDQTVASLRAWTGFIADVARVEVAETPETWRLRLIPMADGCCPVELLLRRDQLHDIAIGSETYEDLPLGIETLDTFLPLLEAIADGRVITRTRSSQATGLLHSVETRVSLADGKIWSRAQVQEGMERLAMADMLVADRHYPAWRRLGGQA